MSENSNRNWNCEVLAPELRRARLFIALLSMTLLGGFTAAAQTPTVTKVDPPSWWANHTINPVRLLVRGTNLHGARVSSVTPTLRPSSVTVNKNGTYLFVDVAVSTSARPGKYSLTVQTPRGRAAIPFNIE